jgi:hypothetical protein
VRAVPHSLGWRRLGRGRRAAGIVPPASVTAGACQARPPPGRALQSRQRGHTSDRRVGCPAIRRARYFLGKRSYAACLRLSFAPSDPRRTGMMMSDGPVEHHRRSPSPRHASGGQLCPRVRRMRKSQEPDGPMSCSEDKGSPLNVGKATGTFWRFAGGHRDSCPSSCGSPGCATMRIIR